MKIEESERRMIAREAWYIDELRQRMSDTLNAEVVAVMASLYRAGWRDCYMEMTK